MKRIGIFQVDKEQLLIRLPRQDQFVNFELFMQKLIHAEVNTNSYSFLTGKENGEIGKLNMVSGKSIIDADLAETSSSDQQ